MTAGEIKTQMLADFPGYVDYLDGINMVKVNNTQSNGVVYNLAGQRVKDSFKGIIVKNGKKYINK